MFGLSKLYTYLIACGLAVAVLGGTYYKGYSSGKDSQIAVYQVQQAKAVAVALESQSRALASEYQAQLALVEKNKKVEVIKVEKKQKIKKITEESEILKNKVCILPKEQAQKINDAMRVSNEEL